MDILSWPSLKKMIKVEIISSDYKGGAGRAAYRLHKSFSKTKLVNSKLIVPDNQYYDYLGILNNQDNYYGKFSNIVFPVLDKLIFKLQVNKTLSPRSSGILGNFKLSNLNDSKSNIVNLHWINSGFMSIRQIAKITKPLVWTLHDMWPFLGAEHLSLDEDRRWVEGYYKYNKNSMIRGLDVDRIIWNIKKFYWKKPIHIVTPSKWMAECVQESKLMSHWSVTVIPNPLDTDLFRPHEKVASRKVFNLDPKKKYILFGAIHGTKLGYKGWSYLEKALKVIGKREDIEIIVIGQSAPFDPPLSFQKINWLGHINDEILLSILYSSVDVVVIPSMQENFPQLGTEAFACGCPVVAFNTTGLSNLINHKVTGYLADPYDVFDLAKGMLWVIESNNKTSFLSMNCRKEAEEKWSFGFVANEYLKLYERVINDQK